MVKLFVVVSFIIGFALWFFVLRGSLGLYLSARRFLKLIKQGELENAYSQMSYAFQKKLGFLEFKKNIDGLGIQDCLKYFLKNVKFFGLDGYVGGDITLKNGAIIPIEINFKKEGREWKIISINLSETIGIHKNNLYKKQ